MDRQNNKEIDYKKAQIYLKFVSWAMIVGAVFSFGLGFDDFRLLGVQTTSFIFPYFFNLFCIGVSIFQIFAAAALMKARIWAKKSLYILLGLRLVFSVFDYFELLSALILLVCLIFVLLPGTCGRLFEKKTAVEA